MTVEHLIAATVALVEAIFGLPEWTAWLTVIAALLGQENHPTGSSAPVTSSGSPSAAAPPGVPRAEATRPSDPGGLNLAARIE